MEEWEWDLADGARAFCALSAGGHSVRSLLFGIRATGCRAHGSRQDIGAPVGAGERGLDRQVAMVAMEKWGNGIWPTERVHAARWVGRICFPVSRPPLTARKPVVLLSTLHLASVPKIAGNRSDPIFQKGFRRSNYFMFSNFHLKSVRLKNARFTEF